MRKIIQNYIDNHDIDGIRYVFMDSLDVDPTFKDYRDDFETCRTIPGLFENNVNLTEFCNDPSKWDEKYWQDLKNDLQTNFSLERFEHMKTVAPVVFKDKVEQIRQLDKLKSKNDSNIATRNSKPQTRHENVTEYQNNQYDSTVKLEHEVEKWNEEEREKREKRQREETSRMQRIHNIQKDDQKSKKSLGIVIIVVVIAILIILAVLLNHNPKKI